MEKIYTKLAEIFAPILSLKYGDKILHYVGFGMAGLLSLTPWLDIPRESVITIAMFSVFLGVIWEMIWRLYGKEFSFLDVVADGLGGLTFGTLYYLIIGGIPFYINIH